jgi:hypothetical protein
MNTTNSSIPANCNVEKIIDEKEYLVLFSFD